MFKMVHFPTCQFNTSANEWNIVRVAFPISEIAKIVNTPHAYGSNPDDAPRSQMFLKSGEVIDLLCMCEDAAEEVNKVLNGEIQ